MSIDEFRAVARDYLRLHLPGHEAEITLGDELLALAAAPAIAGSGDTTAGRFSLRRVALCGDSHRAANVGYAGDFIAGPVYVRVILGQPFERPHCVHYTVCAVGMVVRLLPEHRMIILGVEPADYVIGETF